MTQVSQLKAYRESQIAPTIHPTQTIAVDESGHLASAACIPLHSMPQLSLMTPNPIHQKPVEEFASRDSTIQLMGSGVSRNRNDARWFNDQDHQGPLVLNWVLKGSRGKFLMLQRFSGTLSESPRTPSGDGVRPDRFSGQSGIATKLSHETGR
ncbi:hypothetical protein BO78DRAFT_399982 [Aspergillus sclerotiicarbonarius CBS 121057]|uniref:Uncharacterized protein n=1 Tax=Aspergillus sclerotiicarbonarius (strain CBS 121057 / IBT 28362) TaxID=1448318 RepID=A0A319E9D9_ASPSB|nr:hypothetical protein BO78DRAFT_399982 [Aspergillus sclerotiicarbonarius CBS 121057]